MERKIGEGHAAAMFRLGLKELRNALNPSRESVADNEIGEPRIAKEDDADAGILELKIPRQRRGKHDVADEFRLQDQNRSDRSVRNLQHLFLAPRNSLA